MAKTATKAPAEVEHVHAVAGGGKKTHSHADPGGKSHTHDGLLPYKGNLGAVAPPASSAGQGQMAERTPALISLQFADATKLAEGAPIPYMTTGEWQWDDLNFGRPVTATRDDLVAVKQYFDENAYGQRLPIIDIHHDSTRAVGTIKALQFADDDPDLLVAVPDWNEGSETLTLDGSYGYTSPNLLVNWKDPKDGRVYPLMAGGLGLNLTENDDDTSGIALTNHPRIKDLDVRRIAAGESGKPGAAVLRFAETDGGAFTTNPNAGPVRIFTTGDPAKTTELLLAEDDGMDPPGDDDGPVPNCVYQPNGRSEYSGTCKGYTRRPMDLDGDGTCLFADMGCNGYRSIDLPIPTSPVWGYAEGVHMADKPKATPDPTAPSATDPPQTDTVKLAEERDAFATKLQLAETARMELAERVDRMEREKTVATVTSRIDGLVTSGRMTPAERDALIPKGDGTPEAIKLAETRAVTLSETDFVLGAYEARTPLVSFSEKGAHGEDAKDSPLAKIEHFAEELRKEHPEWSPSKARSEVTARNPELMAEYQAAQPVSRSN